MPAGGPEIGPVSLVSGNPAASHRYRRGYLRIIICNHENNLRSGEISCQKQS